MKRNLVEDTKIYRYTPETQKRSQEFNKVSHGKNREKSKFRFKTTKVSRISNAISQGFRAKPWRLTIKLSKFARKSLLSWIFAPEYALKDGSKSMFRNVSKHYALVVLVHETPWIRKFICMKILGIYDFYNETKNFENHVNFYIL